jgi:hypothetical protein
MTAHEFIEHCIGCGTVGQIDANQFARKIACFARESNDTMAGLNQAFC